jgi:predicted phosphodiesterase
MLVEKIFLKDNKNTQYRDVLFFDIALHRPENLFLLGDLTSNGSKPKRWGPVLQFVEILRKFNTNVYAIPGNHEYFGNERKGMQKYTKVFPDCPLYGYYNVIDSVAIVMLNSNNNKIPRDSAIMQLAWFWKVMNILDSNGSVKVIIVCTHHAPYTNSKVVSPSKFLLTDYVPRFEKSPKAKLFISGHSHNLEVFGSSSGKHYIVDGGGGGLTQPLLKPQKRLYKDIVPQDTKPIFFYLIVNRAGDRLSVKARGVFKDFIEVRELEIGVF